MSAPLLPGGFVPTCVGALATWLIVATVGVARRREDSLLLPVLTGLGSALLLVAALWGGDAAAALPLPWFLGEAPLAALSDPLSRWFLGLIGLIGIPVVCFAPGYLRHLRDRVAPALFWSALALLLASMAGVVLAANALAFLVMWELMALSSYALVAADHHRRSIRKAALVYLGATRVGTASLMAGFLWVHQLTGTWSFADWHLSGAAALGPALLIFVGLAVKAGCWPFHLWLPIAHPAAPAPVSALMSGGHDQDRDLRHGAPVRRGRPPLGAGPRPADPRARRHLGPLGRALRPPAARPQAPAGLPQRGRISGSS